MEKVKNKSRISKMLSVGELNYRDPKTGYTYTLCAVCPTDGHDCSITSHDRDTEANRTRITRVVFACPACGNRFTAKVEDMYLK
ncbi:MAG: hypothetical protein JW954_02675 [Dehalococcoidaceae bacterium]|nr:hypothetical protein [Dehalococcoidaceae bacterium]